MMINIISILVFLVSTIFILQGKKAKSQSEYVTAGKNTNLFYLISTLVMTEINPMALIVMASLGYQAGYRAFWMAAIAFLSPFFATVTTCKKWKDVDVSCVSTLFDRHLGYAVGNVVRIILIVSLLILTATYLKGTMIYFNSIYPQLSSTVFVILILIFCVVSVIRNGLIGIIRMDVVGFILMTILILACLIACSLSIFSSQDFGSIERTLTQQSTVLPANYLIALFFLQSIMYSIAPWWGQKIFSAKDTNTAYKASVFSSVLIFTFYSAVVAFGIFLKQHGVALTDPDTAFPLTILTFIPSNYIVFYDILFFYIATTTICGVWSSILGMISLGFLQKTDHSSPTINYFIWVLIGLISCNIALNNIESVLHAAVLAVMQIASIYFSVIAIFYFKRISRLGSLVSIFLGIFLGYFFLYYLGEEGNYIWYWAIVALPAMFISGYFFSNFSNAFKKN
ncbi:hypothetical protein [Legionella quateirensis]|uniref:Na+/panthothenate symporter n=2 Tax=Legionella quateirensis TaxID=45072 RepID=A0A378KZ93_9GAMM|nr:hypothetical protein [Legionella quateirensis]KTD53035.1 hypothetical protein Lqua_0868 [Legionella quateirensis]STY17180.1 Na+/panthothenate symporter [Legionella quateirensis]